MNRLNSYARFLLNTSWSKKTAVARIFILYLKFSVIVEIVPLKFYYKKYLEVGKPEQAFDLQPYRRELGLINRIGKRLPWKNKCIVESLVTSTYMKSLGINMPISLGVALEEGFYAHAWCLPLHAKGYTEIIHENEV